VLLVDDPSAIGGNVLERPAQVDSIQAKPGEGICLVFHATFPLLHHLIFERYAFRVILLKPRLGCILVREDLKVIPVANLLAGIHIDQNGHWCLSASLTPTGFCAVWIERANDVTVQCSQHSNLAMHQEVPAFRGADQAVDGGLPFG
jgi:hypothetical protein